MDDGTPIIARGIGRFLQLEIRLFGSHERFPRLDQVRLQFSDRPAVETVLAEIWPLAVRSSEPVTFTYVVKPTFGPDSIGFDRLEIVTHSRVRTVRSVSVAGEELDRKAFPPEIQDDRLIIGFPPLLSPDANLVPVEVVFDVPVLRFGTEFAGWVFNSTDVEGIRQGVEPGNATFRFSGDDVTVRAPIGGSLLVNVSAFPNPFTPNGDGANDLLNLSFNIREVTTARQVALAIYDIGGRQVQRMSSRYHSGEFVYRWDGSNATGEIVPPGLYIYRLELNADSQEQRSGTIAVVY